MTMATVSPSRTAAAVKSWVAVRYSVAQMVLMRCG